MSRAYVDNAANRRAGRVGLPIGSAVISSSSRTSGGSSFSGSSSTRSYVDNSFNRSAGRVGLPVGSAVISSSSRSSGGNSPAASSSSRSYVDNSFNRSAGRVGLPIGSAVISSSSRDSTGGNVGGSGSGRTYADNSFNRSVGRVGLPMGSAVISSSSRNTSGDRPSMLRSGCSSGEREPQENLALYPASNLLYPPHSSGVKLYVDNAINRRLGRVGLPVGSHVPRAGNSATVQKTYVDNDMNRKLGRVGLPLGSLLVTGSSPKRPQNYGVNDPSEVITSNSSNLRNKPNLLHDVFEHLTRKPDEDFDFVSNYENIPEQDHLAAVDQVLDYFARALEINQWRQESNCQDEPKTSKKLLKDFSGSIIQFKDIELRRIIGHGAFGDVHAAKYHGTIIAVKKLRVQRVAKKRLQAFTDEVSVLSTLNHKNIVRFIGACVVTPDLCICMEFMKTSLFEALHMEEVPFSEREKVDIMVQIGSGLAYLHEEKVAHCDVKSANVLLDYEPNVETTAKLTDFGLAMMKNDADSSSSGLNVAGNRGTPKYSAPEVLRGERLNLSDWKCADVYSISLVFFEVACEVEPFDGLSVSQLTKQVGEKSLMPKIPNGVHLDARFEKQLKLCWNRSADRRPSASEVVDALHRTDKVLRQ